MSIPESLKSGDTIAIVAPAKAIEQIYIDFAVEFWENAGFQVKLGKTCSSRHHYFSGTDKDRLQDFQQMLDDDNVKAIICARGGYGCVRIVDRLNWSSFLSEPKWIIGFSDVTVFHQHIAKMGSASLHATMPLNYRENTKEALETMVRCLKGETLSYQWETNNFKNGRAQGRLIGGNLAVLVGLVGTDAQPNYQDAILYLEDVGEYLYSIDRMFYTLSKSGILDQLKGVVIGDFSNIKDTEQPFGQTMQEIILAHFTYRNIPVAFDFPLGHCNDNRAMPNGMMGQLSVEDGKSRLEIDKNTGHE
jgi:muramoyltetrapeptide carboxypeptidase